MDNQQNINYQPQSDKPEVVQPQWQYQSGQLQPQANPNPASAAPNAQNSSQQAKPNDDGSLASWSASEFIAHEKPKSWYFVLFLGSVVAAALIFLITREVFSVIMVLVLATALAVYAGVKPRVLSYAIYPEGFKVGNKLYPFVTFRSFSVMDDTRVPSIQLLPQKRFMVPISVYCNPSDIDAIADILGEFLPYEQKERDMIDKFSSRMRF